MTRGLTLDAGALIAIDRGDARVRALLAEAIRRGWELAVLPEVIARVWRGGPRQARLAAFLAAEDLRIPAYDALTARAVGVLCGSSGDADVVDAHVVLHAVAEGHAIVTSDPRDLETIDSEVVLIRV